LSSTKIYKKKIRESLFFFFKENLEKDELEEFGGWKSL